MNLLVLVFILVLGGTHFMIDFWFKPAKITKENIHHGNS